jgi:transcriptional regulator with XRE-family HTH domain
MSNENDLSSTYTIPIGKEVAILRTLLNCTQQKFANLLLVSRVTVSKLEQGTDINILTPDIAFRLYYVTQKIISNQYKESYVIEQAKTLQNRVDAFLQGRINTK